MVGIVQPMEQSFIGVDLNHFSQLAFFARNLSQTQLAKIFKNGSTSQRQRY